MLGKNWIMESKFLILQVSSAVNPNEVNYLINVLHQDSEKIQVKKIYHFEIDDRLMK